MSVPPLVDPSGLERVDGVTLDSCVGRRDVPRFEELPRGGGVVEVVDRLRRQTHELPAAPPRTAGDDGGGPGRVAELQVGRLEHTGFVEDDVDDQPVVEEPEVGELGVDLVADHAVAAVAADDVARPELSVLSGRCGHVGARFDDHRSILDADDVAVIDDGGHFGAGADRDRRQCSGPVVEHVLELGLVEHRAVRPAADAGAAESEAQQGATLGVAPFVVVRHLGDRGEPPADPAALQDAGDLVVEVDRSGEWVWRRPALEHDHAVTELTELDRQHAADRPVSHDGHVEDLICSGHLALTLPSSTPLRLVRR